MKIVLVLASCCLLLNAASAQWIAGTPIPYSPRRGGRAAALSLSTCTEENAFEMFCDDENKCNAKNMMICTGANDGAIGECNYCEKVDGEAVCSDSAPDTCPPQAANFKCTSEGFFPDPSDCHKFYQCVDNGAGKVEATPFSCPAPYVFDPSGPNNKFCRQTNGNIGYCTTAKCTDKAKLSKPYEHVVMKFNWYPTSKGQYVATCIGGKAGLVTRCPAGLTPNLKTSKAKCELVCTRAAVAAHITDITKYYECLYDAVSRSWYKKDQNCFKGYYFDEKQKTCVQAPKCSNGANNPPKCDTCPNGAINPPNCDKCNTNNEFKDDLCVDCGTEILTGSDCAPCPVTGTQYDATIKACACIAPSQAIDTNGTPACKACPSGTAPAISAFNPTTKECDCVNGAIKPFEATGACSVCPDPLKKIENNCKS